jgi:hypothetical protein
MGMFCPAASRIDYLVSTNTGTAGRRDLLSVSGRSQRTWHLLQSSDQSTTPAAKSASTQLLCTRTTLPSRGLINITEVCSGRCSSAEGLDSFFARVGVSNPSTSGPCLLNRPPLLHKIAASIPAQAPANSANMISCRAETST